MVLPTPDKLSTAMLDLASMKGRGRPGPGLCGIEVGLECEIELIEGLVVCTQSTGRSGPICEGSGRSRFCIDRDLSVRPWSGARGRGESDRRRHRCHPRSGRV